MGSPRGVTPPPNQKNKELQTVSEYQKSPMKTHSVSSPKNIKPYFQVGEPAKKETVKPLKGEVSPIKPNASLK